MVRFSSPRPGVGQEGATSASSSLQNAGPPGTATGTATTVQVARENNTTLPIVPRRPVPAALSASAVFSSLSEIGLPPGLEMLTPCAPNVTVTCEGVSDTDLLPASKNGFFSALSGNSIGFIQQSDAGDSPFAEGEAVLGAEQPQPQSQVQHHNIGTPLGGTSQQSGASSAESSSSNAVSPVTANSSTKAVAEPILPLSDPSSPANVAPTEQLVEQDNMVLVNTESTAAASARPPAPPVLPESSRPDASMRVPPVRPLYYHVGRDGQQFTSVDRFANEAAGVVPPSQIMPTTYTGEAAASGIAMSQQQLLQPQQQEQQPFYPVIPPAPGAGASNNFLEMNPAYAMGLLVGDPATPYAGTVDPNSYTVHDPSGHLQYSSPDNYGAQQAALQQEAAYAHRQQQVVAAQQQRHNQLLQQLQHQEVFVPGAGQHQSQQLPNPEFVHQTIQHMLQQNQPLPPYISSMREFGSGQVHHVSEGREFRCVTNYNSYGDAGDRAFQTTSISQDGSGQPVRTTHYFHTDPNSGRCFHYTTNVPMGAVVGNGEGFGHDFASNAAAFNADPNGPVGIVSATVSTGGGANFFAGQQPQFIPPAARSWSSRAGRGGRGGGGATGSQLQHGRGRNANGNGRGRGRNVLTASWAAAPRPVLSEASAAGAATLGADVSSVPPPPVRDVIAGPPEIPMAEQAPPLELS
ncbi:unnamed protein product [Amoebophrya sp. A120]|nr:unnamed protein product [Amoebophrya sp. A120]|eukprot:GSA120T00013789001.1